MYRVLQILLCAAALGTAACGHGEVSSDGASADILSGSTVVNGKRITLACQPADNGLCMREGDIALARPTELGTRGTMGARGVDDVLWPSATIPFVIEAASSADRIQAAIDHWHAQTDVRFVERTDEADYVALVDASGCWSYVGRQGDRQELGVSSACSTGSIIHELGHAFGLYHEQTREDRDDFVTINWDNITDGKELNFRKYSSGADMGAYDFGSIMHYGEYYFSANGEPTIVAHQGDPAMGQRVELSSGDLQGIAEIVAATTTTTPPTTTPPPTPTPPGFYRFHWAGDVYYVDSEQRYCVNPPAHLVRDVKGITELVGNFEFTGSCPDDLNLGSTTPTTPTTSTLTAGFYRLDGADSVYYVDAEQRYCINPPGHLIRDVTNTKTLAGLQDEGSCPDDLILGASTGAPNPPTSAITRGFYNKDDGKDTVYFVIDGKSYCDNPPGDVMRDVTVVSGLEELQSIGKCSPSLDYD